MKTRIGLFFLLLGGGVILFYLDRSEIPGGETAFRHRATVKDIPSHYDPKASIPNSTGIADDPIARAGFEVQRLKDPYTGLIPSDIYRKELGYARQLPKSDGLLLYKQKNQRSSPNNIEFSQRGPANLGGRTRAVALDVTDASVCGEVRTEEPPG